MPKKLDTNGGITRVDENKDPSLNTGSPAAEASKEIKNDDFSSLSPTIESEVGQKPLSPYPNVRHILYLCVCVLSNLRTEYWSLFVQYPDLKPPSSPSPSKPT